MPDRVSNIVEQIRVNLQRQFPQRDVPLAQPFNPRNEPKFGTGQVTVGTSPVQLVGPRPTRTSIRVTNLSQLDVYLGNSPSVTSTTGDLLCGGRGQWVSYDTASTVFAVVSVGSAVIAWSEVYE